MDMFLSKSAWPLSQPKVQAPAGRGSRLTLALALLLFSCSGIFAANSKATKSNSGNPAAKSASASAAPSAEASAALQAMERELQPRMRAALDGKLPAAEVERVVAELEILLTRKVGHAPTLEALGILRQRLERFDGARQALIGLASPSSEALRSLALSHFGLGEYRKAAAAFARLPDPMGKAAEGEKYAQSLQQSGKRADAVKAWEQYRFRYPQSEAGVDFLAEAYRNPLQKDKLIPLLESMLKKRAGTPDEASMLKELATLYGPSHSRAVELRERYLKLAPEDPEALRALGKSFEERGNKLQAVANYEKAATYYGADGAFLAGLARLAASLDPNRALPWFEKARALLPRDADLALAHAQTLRRASRPDDALAAYGDALRIKPDHAAAKQEMLALAEGSKSEGSWMEALLQSERKNPKDHALQFKLAKWYLSHGKPEDGYRYLVKALQNAPKEEAYLNLLPVAIKEEGQILKHFPQLQDLQKQGRSDPEFLVLLARGYSLYKNVPRAAEVWAELYHRKPESLQGKRSPIFDLAAAKNMPLTATLADAYLVLKPTDVEVRRLQAKALAETNAPEGKLRQSLTLLLQQDVEAETWALRLAELDLRARDTAAALTHAIAWVRAHPQDKRGYQMVQALAKNAKGREAVYLDALDNLARIESGKSANYELEMAYHYYDQGEWARAVEALARLIPVFPNDAQFWNRYGRAQQSVGREGASAALEKATRLDPGRVEYARDYVLTLKEDEEIKRNLSALRLVRQKENSRDLRQRLARSLYLNGEYAASAAEWDGLLREQPELGVTDSTASLAYLKTSQMLKARPLLEKRLERTPRDVLLMTTLAEMYGRENRQSDRAAMMERIVQEDFTAGDWELRLAKEKERIGELSEGLRHYGRWTLRNPTDVDALRAYQALSVRAKDTLSLIDALRMLVKLPGTDDRYRFQLAEIDYQRSGELDGLEAQVKQKPEWREGQLMLLREYHQKGDLKNLGRFETALQREAANSADWLEVLGDLRHSQGRKEEAAKAYYDWAAVKRKDREVFDKAGHYLREQKSAYLIPLLRLGVESFGDDLDLRQELAQNLGKTAQALEVWGTLLTKKNDHLEALMAASELALSLGKGEEAIRYFSRWNQLSPKEERPLRALTELYSQRGDRAHLAETLEALCGLTPGDKALLVRLGELQTLLNRPEKAIAAYRTALFIDVKDIALRERLMGLLKTPGGKPLMAEVLTEIQSLDSSAHAAQFELAKLMLQQGQKEKAYAYLASALDKSPKNQVYQSLLPRTIHNRGQMKEHFALLEELALRPSLVKTDVQNFDLFFWLGRGYALQQKWDKAGIYFAFASRLKPGAFKEDREAVLAVYQAKDYPLAADLADQYLKTVIGFEKDVRQVQILSYEKTKRPDTQIRQSLQDLLLFDKENAGALLRLAEIDLRAGDTVMAITDIRTCLQTNPNEVRAYRMLLPLVTGKTQHKVTYVVVLEKLALLDSTQRGDYRLKLADFYQQRRNFRETTRLLGLVVQDKPADAQAWYRLGQCRNQLQTGDNGISCFRRAWELVPENLIFARTYGQTLREPEAIKANLKLFQFLEARGPSTEERRQLALSHYYRGDFASAAISFDKLLAEAGERDKRQPEASHVYLQTRQPVKALPLYAFRWNRDSANVLYLDTLHGLQVATGDAKGRLRTLETLVANDPEYKDFQLQLAQVYDKLNQGKAALPHFGQWTARHPKDAEALKAMQRIANVLPDTVALETSLRLLTVLPGSAPEYHFQLAELDFKFSGNIAPAEKLVKAYPQWRQGKLLLAREYYRRDQVQKLQPFEKELAEEVRRDPSWLEPMGDLYAYTNRKNEANSAYFALLQGKQKSAQGDTSARSALRRAFDKAWLYGESNGSPNQKAVLAIGYAAFPEDVQVAHAYAQVLGPGHEALKIYLALLARNSSDLIAIRAGAAAALAAGDLPAARKLSSQWTEAEPMDVKSWQSLIAVTEKQGDLPARVVAMERLLELNSIDHALCFRIGQAYVKLEQREKALEYLVRADEMKPKDAVYAGELIATLEAEASSQITAGRIDRATEFYGMLLQRQPKHKRAQLYVGLSLAEAGDIQGSEPLLTQGLDQSPEPRPIVAKGWRLLGEGLAMSGRLPKALEAFKKALALDPNDRKAAQDRLDAVLAANLKTELPAAYADMVRVDSSHVDACRGLAEMRMVAGDFAQAAALYRRVVLGNDQDSPAWAELGEAQRNLKRFPEAQIAFQKAYDLGDRSARVMGGLVRLLKAQGTLAEHVDLLEAWVSQSPEDQEAVIWAGEIALKKGDLAHAEEMYAQAAAMAPEQIDVQEGLADVFLRRDDAESTLETLEPRKAKLSLAGRTVLADALSLSGRFEDAEAAYRQVLSQKPTGRAAAGLTRVLLERKRPQEARKLWTTYNLETTPEAEPARVRIDLALRERDKAIRGAKAWVSKNPQSPDAHLLLATVQIDRRDDDGALASVAQARQLGSTSDEAAYLAGGAQLLKGDLPAARREFLALEQSGPRHTRSLGLQGLANCARAEKNLAEARDNLSFASELYPSPAVLAELSSLALALGQIDEAEQHAQKSLELDDAYPDGNVALAETMLQRGKPQEAKDYLREALEKNPYACELHNERAKVEMTLGNLEGLASSSKQALALCPDQAMPWYYAGIAADRSYQKKQAEDHFAQYKKLGGDGAILPVSYQGR